MRASPAQHKLESVGSSQQTVPLHRRPVAMHTTCRSSVLALWHLLSLDAPTVATLWTWFIARRFHCSLSPFELIGMFLAVWILYVVDRLLDTRASDGSHPSRTRTLQPRHHFHDRHRRVFSFGLILATTALAICITHFSHIELALYLLLGALLALWFSTIHWASRRYSLRLPKELAVGFFFAAAVFVPTLSRQPGSPIAMLAPALFLGALCAINGLFIHTWEHACFNLCEPDDSDTDAITRCFLRRTPQTALLCCLVPLAIFAWQPRDQALLQAAISLSALALLVVHRFRHNFEQTSLRALADFALLSPLLLVSLLR